jgi:hypothetical protein
MSCGGTALAFIRYKAVNLQDTAPEAYQRATLKPFRAGGNGLDTGSRSLDSLSLLLILCQGVALIVTKEATS